MVSFDAFCVHQDARIRTDLRALYYGLQRARIAKEHGSHLWQREHRAEHKMPWGPGGSHRRGQQDEGFTSGYDSGDDGDGDDGGRETSD